MALPAEPKKSGAGECRAGLRYPFTAAAEVLDVQSKVKATGRCADLSVGGCYVDTISPFSAGTPVHLRIERDDLTFEAEAVVTYAHVQMGMGLAFTEIKREHQAALRSWIAEASGERAPSVELPAPGPKLEPAIAADESNVRFVLNGLIIALVRRKAITEYEGAELLRHLFR
jgi:hypothetical protein